MNKKLLYSAPEAELLVIKFEENFCQTGRYGEEGAAGNKFTSGGSFDFDDED